MQDSKSLFQSFYANAISRNARNGRLIIPKVTNAGEAPALRFLQPLAGTVTIVLLAAILSYGQTQEVRPRLDLPAAQSLDGGRKAEPKPAAVSTKPGLAPRSDGSRFALAFKTSTLGLGADLGVRLAGPLNLRCGFGTFRYTQDLSQDGVPYHGTLHLRSLQAVVDWFPFANSFHVSSGLLFYNGNHITAIAKPPVGSLQSAGDIVYVSDPQNPLTGRAQSGPRSVAPMIAVGFGNLVPRSHHFAYSVDVGVVYQGRPKSDFTLQGGTCDPAGIVCAAVDPTDSNFQALARSAIHDLNSSVSFMRFYPAVTVEFGYHF